MKDLMRKVGIWGTFISPIIFVILTTIAMLFLFPGGYTIDGTVFPVSHYLFDMNPFSDLGMLTTVTGISNLPSAILFCVSVTLTGISVIIYARTFPSYFPRKSTSRTFSIIGMIFAYLASIGFIGIAFTPWDVLLTPHVIFVFFAFPISAVYGLFYALAIFTDKSFPKILGIILVIFTLCMGVYLYFLFGFDYSVYDGFTSRRIGILAQKAIIYVTLLTIMIQSLGTHFYLKKMQKE